VKMAWDEESMRHCRRSIAVLLSGRAGKSPLLYGRKEPV